jgi:hypothetical protein
MRCYATAGSSAHCTERSYIVLWHMLAPLLTIQLRSLLTDHYYCSCSVDPRGDYAYKKPKHSSSGKGKSGTLKDGESTTVRPSYAQLRAALPRCSEATIESLALVDESIINYEVCATNDTL